MTPASAGPAVSMTWKLSRFSASPAGSWLAGSSLGMKVLRAGRSTAPSADCAATSAYSSQTRRSPAKAWAANAADSADREGRVGEVIDLENDGEAGQGAANRRQGRPGPQPPERRGLTQRPDICQQTTTPVGLIPAGQALALLTVLPAGPGSAGPARVIQAVRLGSDIIDRTCPAAHCNSTCISAVTIIG